MISPPKVVYASTVLMDRLVLQARTPRQSDTALPRTKTNIHNISLELLARTGFSAAVTGCTKRLSYLSKLETSFLIGACIMCLDHLLSIASAIYLIPIDNTQLRPRLLGYSKLALALALAPYSLRPVQLLSSWEYLLLLLPFHSQV